MTNVIELHKVNEVYIQVTTEPSIEKEISDLFKYRLEGYQHTPAGRNGWQGWIYLFNIKKHLLFAGHLKRLLDFAKEHNYTVEYNADLFIANNFSLIEAKDFIKSLNIHSNGKSLIARDNQELGLAKAIRYKKITIISPTRSGKSFVLYSYIRYLLDSKTCRLGLLLVPTKSLVEQMFTDFQDYSSVNQWPVQDRIQRLYGGFTSDIAPETRVLVATWQSLYKLDPEYFEQFDFLICDEAHTAKAKEIGNICTQCINAGYRLGVTGTDHDNDLSNIKIEGYFGPITKLTTTKKLMDAGHVASLNIKSIVLKHPPGTKKIVKSLIKTTAMAAKYQAEIDYIVDCLARNLFLRNLVLSIEGTSLVMFNYERHGVIIHDLIREKLDESLRKLFFINGKTETEVREQVRRIANDAENSIIVGSSVFATGITIPNLRNIILATPTKAKIRTLQTIGRSLGIGDNKTTATVYDIADDFSETKYERSNYTFGHYLKRLKFYEDEKFDITTYEVIL